MIPKTPDSKQQKAGPGKHIVIELATTNGTEQMEFDIVQDTYADFTKGFLGASTPLARAVEGKTAGQTIPYSAGDAKSIKIMQVEPAKTPPPKEIEQRRKDTIRKAVDQSDKTNAMIFASSFSGKWGDYDPT